MAYFLYISQKAGIREKQQIMFNMPYPMRFLVERKVTRDSKEKN